jgi:pimeloyl-ACP methyl ester carboxylesterase
MSVRVTVGDHALEIAWFGPPSARAIVMLHEGLGCIAMWRTFPAEVAARCGRSVLAYSRRGYGGSDPVTLPRPLDYMEREARGDLPVLLDALGVEEVVLVGHSDGASIALVHAAEERGRVRACALLAPHVFAEDVSVKSIAAAKVAYETGELRARLAKYHGDNVDGAFRGWNDAWLDPEFRRWSLVSFVPKIAAPILVIQGEDDEYGTLAQVEAIERAAQAPFAKLVLPHCGHAPHRDAPKETLEAIARLCAS